MHSVWNACQKACRLLQDLLIILSGKPAERIPGKVLIVRIDATGDYLLFRGALRRLRESNAFRGSELVLCGNALWQNLATKLDGDLFDEFIPVDVQRMRHESTYRKTLLATIKKQGADICLNPAFSRNYLSDVLALASGARRKVGFASTALNIGAVAKGLTDNFYHERVELKRAYEFELHITDRFLEHLGVRTATEIFQQGTKELLATFFLKEELHTLKGRPVLFLGANSPDRRWPARNFARLALFIKDHTGLFPLFTGGNDVREDTARSIPSEFISHDITSRTSLLELCILIAEAPFVVSNDSFAAHIASACAVPTLIISNGQHAGRFHPYPENIAPGTVTIYPPSITFGANAIRKLYYSASPYEITDISPNAVCEALNRLLLGDLAGPVANNFM